MSRMDHFRQGGTPFDRFLYSSLGQDTAGNGVSVLSALARLGVDPWDEAADLSALSNAGAQTRLTALLARFADVALPDRAPLASIPELVALLPATARNPVQLGPLRLQNVLPERVKMPSYGVLIAIFFMALFVAQTFFLGSDGSGN